MSYNWKCCSFYPNNFDASALAADGIRSDGERNPIGRRTESDRVADGI